MAGGAAGRAGGSPVFGVAGAGAADANPIPKSVHTIWSSPTTTIDIPFDGESSSIVIISGNIQFSAGPFEVDFNYLPLGATPQAIQYLDLKTGTTTGLARIPLFTFSVVNPWFASFTMTLNTKSGFRRGGSLSSVASDATTGTGGNVGSFYWNDLSTVVTSFQFKCNVTNGMNAGRIIIQFFP